MHKKIDKNNFISVLNNFIIDGHDFDDLKNNQKDFSRKRALSFSIVIMIIINLLKGKNFNGYDIIMNRFWSECKKIILNLNQIMHHQEVLFVRRGKK